MKQFDKSINNKVLYYLKNKYPADFSKFASLLERYAGLLREYNARINLISRKDDLDIFAHHIIPSIIADVVLNITKGTSIIDIGSGAGLPGIPFAICRPDVKVVLIDSIRKKHLFQKLAIESLELPNVSPVLARLPLNSSSHISVIPADMVMARAVSNMASLISLSRPLLKPGGCLIAWKGSSDESEIKETLNAFGLMGDILEIPPVYHSLSPKLQQLRLVKVCFK